MGRRRAMSVLPLALLLLIAPARPRAPTAEPGLFEAAFQGRCGEASPCEQLCLELHDGTFECACGPGYVLHVDGYECLELNATKAETSSDEDVIYEKGVSFTAELDIAPSTKLSKPVHPKITAAPSTVAPLTTKDYVYRGEKTKELEGLQSLIDDGVSNVDLNIISDDEDEVGQMTRKVTTLGPSLDQKVPIDTVQSAWTEPVGCHCSCDEKCSCGSSEPCPQAAPRFSGASWLALRALRGAYKRVRARLRFRPERARGVLLLTGEHDDLSGDYLALVLLKGHVELRFDCGSGAGVLRSPEPVRLGRWNTVTVFRHRWDAWLRLNSGKRVRGRSKGLFSRMTFREPVWVGGAGNTTGLQAKLGLTDGLLGCVDYLRINADTYRLPRDAVATYDLADCAPALGPHTEPTSESNDALRRRNDNLSLNDIVHFEDNDIIMRDSDNRLDNSIESSLGSKIHPDSNTAPSVVAKAVDDEEKSDEGSAMRVDLAQCACAHGGGCIAGVCLCPLGYAGARCEITLDLKVPRFNGSSYLRLPGLGKSAASWLDIQLTIRPTSGDGLLLYNADLDAGATGVTEVTEVTGVTGDFISLHLRDYFVEFAFDLGSGVALVRSAYPLTPNAWHKITVSRSGRHATLGVTNGTATFARRVRARGTARSLSLRQPLLLGGAPRPLPGRLGLRSSFSGCVSRVIINDEELSVVSAALGGVNVDNCDATPADSCADQNLCKESLEPLPHYQANISETDQHNVVPKKGFHLKAKKSKHIQHSKLKRKKHISSKKSKYYQEPIERSNDVMSDEAYDGRTYMQVKYLDTNDINWGDTNTYPSFMGTDSFIHIDDEETMKRLLSYSLDINIRFRCVGDHGLLVWSGAAPRPDSDFLSLGVEDSVLVFRYNLGSGEVVIVANRTRVDDGLWHRARATRNRRAGVLEVDGLGSVGSVSPGPLKQLNTRTGLYIGGLPSIEMAATGRYRHGLVGCVSQISLSGDFDIPLSLSKLPHTITNNVGRCVP